MNPSNSHRAALLLAVLLGLSACGQSGPSEVGDADTVSDDAAPAGSVCVTPWSEAYGRRFQAGETFFLPEVSASEACAELSWTLTDAPEGSEAELMVGATYARLTPLVPGDYTFALAGPGGASETTVALEVLDALERPFHNYNYFPSHRSGALVEGEHGRVVSCREV